MQTRNRTCKLSGMEVEIQTRHPRVSHITVDAHVQETELHTQFCIISLSPFRIPHVLNRVSEECDGLLSREICLSLPTILTACFQARSKLSAGNLLVDG